MVSFHFRFLPFVQVADNYIGLDVLSSRMDVKVANFRRLMGLPVYGMAQPARDVSASFSRSRKDNNGVDTRGQQGWVAVDGCFVMRVAGSGAKPMSADKMCGRGEHRASLSP